MQVERDTEDYNTMYNIIIYLLHTKEIHTFILRVTADVHLLEVKANSSPHPPKALPKGGKHQQQNQNIDIT